MKNRLMFLCLAVMALVFVLGCTQDLQVADAQIEDRALAADELSIKPAPAKLIKDKGVIRYIDLEGGFYGIIGSTTNYDPINLPKAFQQDGLQVEFTAYVGIGMVSIHQWGVLIKLVTMQSVGSERRLVMDNGVMEHYLIQGSPWVIAGTTGSYQPINLPVEYEVEGLKVAFVAVVRPDIVIIPPLWPIIEILEIQRIGGGPQKVKLNTPFKLQVTKSALEPTSGIVLTFKEVLQDSRCPIGVECFWQGEAVVLVNVKIAGRDYGNYKMSTISPRIIQFGAYYVQFRNLWPYPDIRIRINPSGYVGEFVIGTYVKAEVL